MVYNLDRYLDERLLFWFLAIAYAVGSLFRGSATSAQRTCHVWVGHVIGGVDTTFTVPSMSSRSKRNGGRH